MFKRNIDFYLIVFLGLFLNSFGLILASENSSDILKKLDLPFQVNFTEKEIKFLNSLSPSNLEKLKKIIKILLERKVNEQKLPLQDLTTSTKNSQSSQPTNQLNTLTTKKPFSSDFSSINSYSQGPDSKQFQSSLPPNFISNNSFLDSDLDELNDFQDGPGTTNNLFDSIFERYRQKQTTEINPDDLKNIDPKCIPNNGIFMSGGSCPNTDNISAKLKITAMQACTAIGRPIPSVSVYRSSSCNKKVGGAEKSTHMRGMAIDISQKMLSSSQRVKVFGVFKLNGFEGVGCYGVDGHVHLDHGTPRRWGKGCPPELQIAGY